MSAARVLFDCYNPNSYKNLLSVIPNFIVSYISDLLLREVALLCGQTGLLRVQLPAAVRAASLPDLLLLQAHLPRAPQPTRQETRHTTQPAHQQDTYICGAHVHCLLATLEPVLPHSRVQPPAGEGPLLHSHGPHTEGLRHELGLHKPLPLRLAKRQLQKRAGEAFPVLHLLARVHYQAEMRALLQNS